MEAKICGVKDINTLKYIINHKYPPKFIGFIVNYKKSKRYVKIEKLKELISIKKKSFFCCCYCKSGTKIFRKNKKN